tara:strand:- start:792 stop:1235 length:444 start_codon:yes stop_codon:yes gene_type:complete
MGYNTTFEGQFSISPPVSYATGRLIDALEDERGDGSKMPASYCQWRLATDSILEWDDGEKFYYYVEWLTYIIESILKPNGHLVNGTVNWHGEETGDSGVIRVTDNKVEAVDASSLMTDHDRLKFLLKLEMTANDLSFSPEILKILEK